MPPPKNAMEVYQHLNKSNCRECGDQTCLAFADIYTDLFDDLVHMFSAQKVARQFEADISVVLHPFPLVPVMICYWLPEDGLASSLNLFFDDSADRNLSIESLYTLAAGLAQMFEKISHRHGV